MQISKKNKGKRELRNEEISVKENGKVKAKRGGTKGDEEEENGKEKGKRGEMWRLVGREKENEEK